MNFSVMRRKQQCIWFEKLKHSITTSKLKYTNTSNQMHIGKNYSTMPERQAKYSTAAQDAREKI